MAERTVSIGTMLRQLAGMADTKDLSDWENGFLKNVLARTGDGARTSVLTEKQVERVEELWKKHFSG
jgi:hypothetical protein